MKPLLQNLFEYHNFTYQELDYGTLYTSMDLNKSYYWLLIEESELSTVLDKQDSWFQKCKEVVENKDFDKNASLLILTDNHTTISNKQDILKIEEDPYQFKKYVLPYDNEASVQLLENSEDGNVIKILDLLVDEEVFNQYKSNYRTYNWRHLLYRIAHKLPFLAINVEVNENLDNLFDDADQTLDSLGLLEYSQFITSFTDEEMEEIKESDIDSLIKTLSNGN